MNIHQERQLKSQFAQAIESRDFALFIEIINDGNINLNDSRAYIRSSWLKFAAICGFFEGVKYIVESGVGANIGHDEGEGITPISRACSGGYIDVVRYLIEHGAILDTGASVRNPLFSCISGWNEHPIYSSGVAREVYVDIARLLIDSGIDFRVRYNTKSMKDMDALAFAMMWGRHDIAWLIAYYMVGDDYFAIAKLLAEGTAVSGRNVEPVPKGQAVRSS